MHNSVKLQELQKLTNDVRIDKYSNILNWDYK